MNKIEEEIIMNKIELTYFASDECPDMLFDTEEEAASFDLILIGYCNNKKAIQEFKNAESQYASEYAVRYNIENGTFIHNLKGPYSDALVIAVECMASTQGDLSEDNPYIEMLNYIINKLYGTY